jgi:transcriptional regulator with XRE-family HTH domain
MMDLYQDIQQRLEKMTPKSLYQMAEVTGVSYSMLSRIRLGKYPHSPTYNNLQACAKYLSRRRAPKAA